VAIGDIQIELPLVQFNNVIRWIKRYDPERVGILRHATFNTLKRLGVSRDKSKSVKGIPNGSDHGDFMSIIAWMDKIENTEAHSEAIAQIVAIDATCVTRLEG
jgi:hypothetical protein